MRKLFVILVLLLLAVVAQGQMIIRANPHARAQVVSAPTEMITNGAFADGTGWTPAAVWTISSGVATYDDTGDGALSQVSGDMVSILEINTDYVLEFDISGATGGRATIGFQDTNGAIAYVAYADYNGDGHYVVNFTTGADLGANGFSIVGKDASYSSWSIDNISLKRQ